MIFNDKLDEEGSGCGVTKYCLEEYIKVKK
jgi:hypothetical protein